MNPIATEDEGGDVVGADEAVGIPSPEECARRSSVAGNPVMLGDGRIWPLAAYVPCLGPVWDRIYDDNLMRGAYEPEDIRLAASHLLQENFDLAPEAVALLIVGADLAPLVMAIEHALFGPERVHQTWSDWVLGSLYANGIDPATVPASRLRVVLDFLVDCRRTIPPQKFISSVEAGARFAAIRGRVKPSPAEPPAQSG
jgi:hypothetical protein